MKTLAAITLALMATATQAGQVFPIASPAHCEKGVQMMEEQGFYRYEIRGTQYFAKDGYIGYLAQPCNTTSPNELRTETVAEFKQRMIAEGLRREEILPVNDRARQEFGRVQTSTNKETQEVADEGFCSSTFCKVTVGVIAVAALVYGSRKLGPVASGCTYSWQTAKDGSRCGGRAATVRPGGN